MTHDKQKQVLDFWFGDDSLHTTDKQESWFTKDDSFDQEITAHFGVMAADAATGAFDDWAKTPRGALALVLLLDQFPRNMFRGDARSFANDAHARRVTEIALDRGFDKQLSATERVFLYLPLEHSEDLTAQRRAVELFSSLVDIAQEDERAFITQAVAYSVSHREIIEKFGRFPHRNDIVGRDSSQDEKAFLKTPNSAF